MKTFLKSLSTVLILVTLIPAFFINEISTVLINAGFYIINKYQLAQWFLKK